MLAAAQCCCGLPRCCPCALAPARLLEPACLPGALRQSLPPSPGLNTHRARAFPPARLQVGIVSHGLYGAAGMRHGRCGDVGQMTAYASVGAFREWIDATVKAEGL